MTHQIYVDVYGMARSLQKTLGIFHMLKNCYGGSMLYGSAYTLILGAAPAPPCGIIMTHISVHEKAHIIISGHLDDVKLAASRHDMGIDGNRIMVESRRLWW